MTFEPKIVGFFCNWCSYLGADMAGTSRLTYPPNVRIIRVPCSGRVDPIFVLRELLDLMGIEPERLQVSFISAAEGKKFAEVAAEVTELIRRLGPLEFDEKG